ncbi:TlpA disulfide reductase family protein [uncultured Cocleimonas sp.]|uniref:TlpA family protein disulfide reductase n=1 Tax=uncultured Cocleimonas sp. TaxID=1051587 RepID=UPI00262DC033|nr:TlpA disulfide reductase family protein [uncultured Cocleimonas sp.]
MRSVSLKLPSVFISLLFLVSLNVHAAPPPESFDSLNSAFPDMTFVDPDGKQAKISDYKGEVVLVKLWATWCGVCRKKWPEHQALYNEIKDDKGVRVITLSVAEDPKDSQKWADEQGYTVPLYVNNITDRGAVQVADDRDSLYFIKGTPMKFLIDKDGILRKKVVGLNGEVTAADIRQLL